MTTTTEVSTMGNIEHSEVVEAVAARLPGAVTRGRASNLLRALEEAGYVVVPAAQLRGAVEAEHARFHEYVRHYGRLGYDADHLDRYLRGEFAIPPAGGQ